ncbi:hypothetical protein C7405_101695 [Paraburkholderia caballeronis]|uniref:hypothetical protein n=1 Tax=Paraburkholderia caballeronis TaxID=416943 RepID=UPI001064660A|nr:hypothetical protein [Paraburkholderia caballeronis]TDV39576.1 hypothetical protein C7405_101695 [Paraburkholderia caballeronis]
MRLTDEQREAIDCAIRVMWGHGRHEHMHSLDVLRALLNAAPSDAMRASSVLTETQMAKIAHDCSKEVNACPGTNMWQCAYMAVEETLKTLAEGHSHMWIAEVCEDVDGYKHIEAVIENLDDMPKGMKLYGTPASDAAVAQEGWKLVPIEPTQEMTNAGLYQSSHDMEWADLYSAWKDMLAAVPTPTVADALVAPGIPVELLSVQETIESGDGFWRSCSGCHATNEGAETGLYPYSSILKCYLGSGCSECGGIGAVWDNTDYGAMADAMLAAPAPTVADAAVAPIDESVAFQAWADRRILYSKSEAWQAWQARAVMQFHSHSEGESQ